jgi:hypothetical protein
LVTWSSHKTKTGGSTGEDEFGAPRDFEAEDTCRDRKACVEAKRGAVIEHPSNGAKNRGSFIFQLPSYKIRGEDGSHFLKP